MAPKKAKSNNLPLIMGGNTVDIFRSKRIANIFFFFVSAAKASLLPFLTIYFRLLGLTPIQTGIVFGTRAIVMAIFVPFWLKISYLCNKKKFLMLCSIVVLIISHLTLTAVPPRDRDDLLMWCPPGELNTSHTTISGHHTTETGAVNISTSVTEAPDTANISTSVTEAPDTANTLLPTTGTTNGSTENSTSTRVTAAPSINTVTTVTTRITTAKPETTEAPAATLEAEPTEATKRNYTEHSANLMPARETETGGGVTNLQNLPTTRKKRSHRRQERHLSIRALSDDFMNDESENGLSREKRGLSMRSIGEKLSTIQSSVYSMGNRTFILVLLIIVAGEMFSCAAEKFADDAWFTLLDSVDDVEKYGSHKYWSAIAYIFYAVIVAIVVDTQDCFLSIRIHHFMIHFYVFAALLVIALFTGVFYPFYPREKPSKHHMTRSKLKILCSDVRSFLFVLTVLIVGAADAGISAFLFWRVQDVGGRETQMGVAIMIRSIAELFMLVFSKQIIRRFGIPFCSVIGLLAMVARLLYFSFLWSPWSVCFLELLYGASNTLLWQSICAHPDFSLNIITRRVTQNIFYVLYYGVGASIGCILAGYGYGYKSLSVVYQCAAVVVGIWAVLFAIAQKCLPKPPQVRYARLLADEDEETDSDEDDWLEMALKNH